MSSRPNLLVIMTDEHNPLVSEPYGHPFVRTPNLQRLAERGVVFEKAYCNSPLTAPSRASFMTGKLVHRIGVWENRGVLPGNALTWAHRLSPQGYDRAISGKMHFNCKDQHCGFQRRLVGEIGVERARMRAGGTRPDGPARARTSAAVAREWTWGQLPSAVRRAGSRRGSSVSVRAGAARAPVGPVRRPDYAAHSHNIFLQSYLEQGVLGLLGLVAIVGVALAIGWRTVAAARDSEARSAALSAGGGALALVLCGLTDVDALTSIGMVLLFVALGLLVAAGRTEQAGPEQAGGFRQLVAWLPPLGGARRGALAGLLAAPVLGGLILAQAVGPRSSGAESLSGPLDRLAAAVYLNLGAVELSRATLHVSGPNVLEARLSPEAVDQQGLARAAWALERAHEHAPDESRGYLVRAALALARSDPAATTALLADAESMAAGGDSYLSFQLGRLYREAGEVERAVVAWSTLGREIGPVTRNGPDAQLIQW